MDIAPPASRSLYRGQSYNGVGEGPGRTVQRGEQYLHVSKDLYRTDLLDAIRPWLTLDSDPADHARLSDRLEAWSTFTASEYCFVVRLVSYGTFDSRAAYFSHARAWKLDALPPGFDPGLNLGCDDAFATPWSEDPPPDNFSSTTSIVRPEQLRHEAETAALFLGHLLHAMMHGYPLVIVAPISDFIAGSALPALVSFARGALPGRLRSTCRLRIYSQSPDVFLRRLGAHLVVIPQSIATAAVAESPHATFLDRAGNKIIGRDSDSLSKDYANAVVDRAVALPSALSPFSERFQFEMDDLPCRGNVRATVRITYNIAYALAGDGERRSKLLAEYLPRASSRLGAGVQWQRLIQAEEWRAFPRNTLIDQLLMGVPDESVEQREFVRAMEDGASALRIQVDDRLPGWWVPEDPLRLRRLIELFLHQPALISERALAERTIALPLDQLAATGALHRLLEAEQNTDFLRGRNRQGAELAAYATQRPVFDILTRAVASGRLPSDWAQVFVRKASADELTVAAEQWLTLPGFCRSWNNVPKILLDRLRELPSPPTALAASIREGCGLDPAEDPETYLRLADLLIRIEEAEGSTRNPLLAALWAAAPKFSAKSRDFLETIAFDSAWHCLRFDALSLDDLLQFAPLLTRDSSYSALYVELDQRVRVACEPVISKLVATAWWYFWRRNSQLDSQDDAKLLHASALAWLKAHLRGQTAPTLEAWAIIVKDLAPHVTGAELAALCDASTEKNPWPPIPPFESEQMAEMISLCADLGALAEIDDAQSRLPHIQSLDVLSRSPFADRFPSGALVWLDPGRSREQNEPSLSLAQSLELWTHAGSRAPQAVDARVQSILRHLDHQPLEAVRAAAHPNLWAHGRFLAELAVWLFRQGTLAAVDRDALRLIEQNIQGDPALRPPASKEFLGALLKANLQKTAGLFDPTTVQGVTSDLLAEQVIDAILRQRADDACWQHLADDIRKSQLNRTEPAQHPLRVIARKLGEKEFSRNQWNSLSEGGWQAIKRVAKGIPTLVAPPADTKTGLPIFHLAAMMLTAGALGRAAVRVIEISDSSARRDVGWWQRLLISLRDFRRYGNVRSADDREDLAMASLFDILADQHDERSVFLTALTAHARKDPAWIPLLSEFGVNEP
ncbi:MAG TPA: hypothetical protein VHW00_20025 [Thermoanaerobaculia bacterium]|nr:hypothetical protein [Thermoanaerobaculia bacterium]